MHAALSGDEFVVTVVDNGRAALDAFNRDPFDVVLLDVEMPEMGGFEVCAGIRGGSHPKTPIVLISSHDDPGFLRRVAEFSASYLAKPVDWRALKQLLRDFT